jgi:hypothetical protein
MIRLAHRDALAGESRAPVSAAPPRTSAGGGAAVSLPSPDGPPDAAERERRSHIRRWAAFMIVHLERAEHEHARHYGYVEALERLRVLIDRELAAARATDSRGGAPAASPPTHDQEER